MTEKLFDAVILDLDGVITRTVIVGVAVSGMQPGRRRRLWHLFPKKPARI